MKKMMRFLALLLCMALIMPMAPVFAEDVSVIEEVQPEGNTELQTEDIEEQTEQDPVIEDGTVISETAVEEPAENVEAIADEGTQADDQESAVPEVIDYRKDAGLNPAFTRGYAFIAEPGAAVYASMASDSSMVNYIFEGTVYVIDRVSGDVGGLEIVYLPEGKEDLESGWIHPSTARPISPEEENEYIAGVGDDFIIYEKSILLGTVNCQSMAEPEANENPEETEAIVPAEENGDPDTSDTVQEPVAEDEPGAEEDQNAAADPEVMAAETDDGDENTTKDTTEESKDVEEPAEPVLPEKVILLGRSTVGLYEKVNFSTAFEPQDAVDTVTYKSSNTKYITVDQNGIVYGKKKGSAYITVTTGSGKSASLKVWVKEAPKSIALTAARTVLGKGETTTTKYSLSANSAGGIKEYVTSDANIVTIGENGVIEAVEVGTAQVWAKTYNNKSSKAITITVKGAPTTVVPEKDSLRIGAGDSCQLGYTLGENEAGAVTFSSSDPAIAEVDANGRIKGVAKGNTAITLTTYNRVVSTPCAVEITDAPEKITLYGRTTVGVGEYTQFTHAIEPVDAAGTVTYTSSNTKYVTVSKDGVVYGKKKGTATITAKTYNGKSASLKVTVKEAPKSITLTAARTVLGKGETTTTKYSLSANSAGGIKEYVTSDANIVTIGENGVIEAVEVGTAQVWAKTYNNKSSKAVTITVKSAPTMVVPEKDSLKIGAGDSYQLGYTFGEDEAGAVTFVSDDPAIAEVDVNGRIKGIAKGSTEITLITYNEVISAPCVVEVTEAPEKILLNGRTTIGVGEYTQFDHVLEPSGIVGTVTYTSSNTKYVTVSKDGLVCGKKKGSATITAKTYNGKSASLKVTVKEAPKSITLSAARTVLGIDETTTTKYSLSANSAGGIKEYVTTDASIVTIDNNGGITAKSVGTAQVYARTYNNKSSKAVTITVKDAPTKIVPEKDCLKIGAGDSYMLGYTLGEDEAGAVTLTSSDEDIVKVDASGRIIAIAKGTAEVTLTAYNGVSSEPCVVEVTEAPEKILLNGRTTIGVGEYIQFTHTLEPSDIVGTVTYTSSNTKYVTVSKDGVVYGKKKGSATITAKTYNGKSASLKVTVKEAPKTITLSAARTVLGFGETTTTKYSLSANSAGGIQKYVTSDEKVVTINGNGDITAVGIGTAQVSAVTYNNKYSKLVTITVKNEPTTVVPEKDYLKIGAGDSYMLGYTLGEDEAGAVTLTSSDEEIVKIDASGRIIAVAKGTAMVTMTTYNGVVSEPCTIEVAEAPEKVTLVGKSTIGLGERLQFYPEFEPKDVVGSVTYKSSNTKYVTVDQNGIVYGKKSGSAYITATTYNGKSASLKVWVKEAPKSISLYAEKSIMFIGEQMPTWYKLSANSAGSVTEYSTSEPSVLQIDKDGVITAVGTGSALVSACTYNNKYSNLLRIEVKKLPTEVHLESEALTIPANEDYTLTYSFGPDELGAVAFESADPDIATVNENGVIHTVAEGMTTITLTVLGVEPELKATCELTVTKALPRYRALIIGEYNNVGGIGNNLPFTKKNCDIMRSTLSNSVNQGKRYEITYNASNPSKSTVQSLVQNTFKDATEDDISVIYIVSHGYRTGNDKYYFGIPKYKTAVNETVYSQELFDWMSGIKGEVVLILDSCKSGGFIYDMESQIRSRGHLSVITAQSADKNASFYVGKDISTTFEFLTLAFGMGLGYSASGTGIPAAYYADSDGNGKITISEAIRYAAGETTTLVNSKRSSYSSSSDYGIKVPGIYSKDALSKWSQVPQMLLSSAASSIPIYVYN